jgi:long-chain acyl-CoA synthetase
MEVIRIFDIVDRYKLLFPDKADAVAGKDNGVWKRYSITEYAEIADNISYGLLMLGIKKGDKIASITFNRPEWNFLDIGIQQIGAIHIPIYPTISDKDYLYILSHAEIKMIFVAGEEMFRRIQLIHPSLPLLKSVYTFKNLHGFDYLGELIELGANNKVPVTLKSIKDSITSDDIATIIYTSGTMANPKGVILSHLNIISNFVTTANILPLGSEHKALSFLPSCHIFERMLIYVYHYKGISIYYAENFGTVADNLKEIQPHIMGTVPRFLEKVYDKINSTGKKLKGVKRIIYRWAMRIGKRYEMYGANGWYYNFKLKIVRKLVFSKWKESLGTNLDVIVSGGAALQIRLARIFWAAGFRVIEGYGLTETSPVLTCNNFEPNGVRFGTVGKAIQGVSIKIAPDGEIIAKGPNVMVGYSNEPELTKEAIDSDGWFHTGDIGTIDEDGFLKITGRKKEIFKTSFGKYIAPMLIENKFKESNFIDQIFVTGENQKFAAALIIPNFVYLKYWCEYKQIPYTKNEEMITHPRIKKRFMKELNKFNTYFGETEQLKKFELLGKEWSIESGELTATLKLRRTFISNKYSQVIKGLFNSSEE